MSKYNKEQWFILTAAALFLIGAMFMLVNTFGGKEWAFWAGLAFAAPALVAYGLSLLEHRKSKNPAKEPAPSDTSSKEQKKENQP